MKNHSFIYVLFLKFALILDNLQSQLSRPRIERLAGRAVGVWDDDKQLVRVERKDGKFGNFGFTIEGQLYLEYYEALFLMEVVSFFQKN